MKMLCRMCLLESEKTLCIFEQGSGQFQIAPTIGRHFWFEPAKNDPISTKICITCWSAISDFHSYYVRIEVAHRQLAEFSAVKEESISLEHLKNEYTDEYMDHKDDSIIENAAQNTTSKTGIAESTCPVFVDVNHEESDSDGDPSQKFFDDYRDYRNDCSSDEESLARRILRTKAEHISLNKEPEKRRLGRKPGGKNKPKTSIVSASDIKFEKHSIEAQPSNPSITTDNDASLLAIVQNCSAVQIEENEPDCDQFESTDMLTKLSRGTKNKLEIIKSSERMAGSAPHLESKEKYKEYDQVISEFLRCELCSTSFNTFAEVKRHFQRTHNIMGYVVCCTEKFYKRVSLYEHIQKHKNPETFKCQLCNKVYGSAQVLKIHLRTHDASFEKSYQCDKCPRRFANSTYLNRHKLTHIPKEEHTFACDICSKTFPSKSVMEIHKKSVHEKLYSKMCHICAKVINGKSLFAKHQLEHAGIVDPKVQCELCGMWLKNAFRLKLHKVRRHSEKNSGDHVCHICEKVLSSRDGLTTHIRKVHSCKGKFACSVCTKSFKSSTALKEHMTTHTGDYLYTCPHCPKMFNSNANMHSHRKKVHRQEWEDSRRSRGLPVNTNCKKAQKQPDKSDSQNALDFTAQQKQANSKLFDFH